MTKNSVGESFTVALILGNEKVWIRKGVYQGFASKILCLTVPKLFVGESFTVGLVLRIEKLYASEGYVTIFDFLSKNFFLTVPKVFAGEPFCAVFRQIPGSEKVYG